MSDLGRSLGEVFDVVGVEQHSTEAWTRTKILGVNVSKWNSETFLMLIWYLSQTNNVPKSPPPETKKTDKRICRTSCSFFHKEYSVTFKTVEHLLGKVTN